MPPKKRKGRKGSKGGGGSVSSGQPKYRFASAHKEDHGKPLFGVSFNPYLSQGESPQYICATVGSNRASIYECLEDGTLQLLQAYVDENPDEVYYSAAWTHDQANDRALLAVAGYLGLIRLVRTDTFSNSRSTESEIALWTFGGEPRLDLPEERREYFGDPITIVRRLPLDNCNIWFVKFDVEATFTFLAAGNQAGKVFLWDMTTLTKSTAPIQVLQHSRATRAVRQVAFSADAAIIVYVCDDGSIHRWDRIKS
ncbi:hypothetical protein PTSG_02945 [Salpingoeca rosetta]|uniref:Uncharacterized protein n=1 Tax=Salpingoeca rosetta (strain ATCC 50818 / BSB-021) TaxID=946362 RepID=F2U3T1_SALR5|nr:uncharacterized protein PTSG_02945 [Salpingoeca rosetta]EGD82275.1 hypothetical protein PTSG_02945 [Salpingoeca rosetta]|eukprot:XP_004996458.1 hypothetical protein PTSG_02945 [Salpingoeca rosetta]